MVEIQLSRRQDEATLPTRKGSRPRVWYHPQFIANIGMDMGEQMISRERYYLGTRFMINHTLAILAFLNLRPMRRFVTVEIIFIQ